MEVEFINHPKVIVFIALLSWPLYKPTAKIFFGDKYEKLWEMPPMPRGIFIAVLNEPTLLLVPLIKPGFFLLTCSAWVVSVAEIMSRFLYDA